MSHGKQVIGLTGGIGSGKSTVADEFARLGAAVVDTDAIAHALTGPGGEAMEPLIASFGSQIAAADGRLDRAVMRERVFADAAERQRLESILHPMIRAESDRQLAVALDDRHIPYAVLVVPLLIETGGYRERVERIVVVDCAEQTQLARVMQRNAMDASQVARIMAAQASRAQRLAQADHVINNDGELASMRTQVALLDRSFRLKSSE